MVLHVGIGLILGGLSEIKSNKKSSIIIQVESIWKISFKDLEWVSRQNDRKRGTINTWIGVKGC